jgi:Cu+-exporting ATPase
MALEPAAMAPTTRRRIYTCPMHPEVEQEEPGTCPKCGMELEPKYVEAEEDDGGELRDMSRRFWVAVALGVPVFLLAMAPMAGIPLERLLSPAASTWIQFGLSTPVVLWSALGRLALLRARLEIDCDMELEHVHADRPGHRSRVRL